MSEETSPQRRRIQDQFSGCLDYTAETWILRLQAEAWDRAVAECRGSAMMADPPNPYKEKK